MTTEYDYILDESKGGYNRVTILAFDDGNENARTVRVNGKFADKLEQQICNIEISSVDRRTKWAMLDSVLSAYDPGPGHHTYYGPKDSPNTFKQ